MDSIFYFRIIEDIIIEKNLEAFLVGGAIRDNFLGRKIRDIDIVLNKRVAEAARCFADKITGSFIILDEGRGIYRVIKNDIVFDFVQMIGANIEEDLWQRDFTINAIALPIYPLKNLKGKSLQLRPIYYFFSLERDLSSCRSTENQEFYKYLIDPYEGINDIYNRKIRVTHSEVFKKDPLRLWRAIRFSVQLDFRIEEKTFKIMKGNKELAIEPASERIREELIKILECDNVSEAFKYMEEKFSFISVIIPEIKKLKETGENKYHQENAWIHSLHVLKALEEILGVSRYRELVDEIDVPILKLTALLHDIGKIKTRSIKDGNIHYYGHEYKGAGMIVSILKKLKFSKKEIFFVKKIITYHMRPLLLYTAENLTDKGKYRFFYQAGILTPAILLHSLADKTAVMRDNYRQDKIPYYCSFIDKMVKLYKDYKNKTDSLYLSGGEIMDLLDLEEGPYIGQLLDKLTTAQGKGQVNNREEAVSFINKIKVNK